MNIPRIWTPELAADWIDEQLAQAKQQFSQTNQAQQVAFRDWCSQWDWAHRSDVYTHLLHSYPAKLLAYIPIAFLTSSYASPTDTVLDSFAGTGTVLLECMAHKFHPRSCYGVEINPLARLIAKVKTTPLPPEPLERLARDLYRSIASTQVAPIPEFGNRDFWFRNAAQRDLARIRYCIDHLDASADERDFFRVCLSAIIRDMSRADPDVAPPVLLKPDKFPVKRQAEIRKVLEWKRRANAVVLFKSKVTENLKRMKNFVAAVGLTPAVTGTIIWDDARNIQRGAYVEAGRIDRTSPKPFRGCVGMVITSPPYLAAQKYVRTTKLEMAWLGLASDDDIHQLDRTTVGTERVTQQEKLDLVPVGNATADALLQKVYRRKPDRAAIASRYYREMRQSLVSIHSVLKGGGVCILVVGDNTIDGLTAKNHAILSEIAAEDGRFITEVILRDPIRSRGLITKRHDTAGVIDDEYVIVLRKQAN